jgi:hypothetical protein
VLKVRAKSSDNLSLEGLDERISDIRVKPDKIQVKNYIVQGCVFIVNGRGI